jgi:hypothetical protein
MKKLLLATLAGGLGMWVTAGLWHNMALPHLNKDIQPHHEGLGLMLIAYFILAGLMTYIYSLLNTSNERVFDGIKLGVIVGVLWVFPHGLAMAGAHDTSVIYEIKNTIWHMVEQGIGGVIVAFVYGKKSVQ